MHCLGVDLGGTAVKMGLFDADGHLICKLQNPVRKADGPEGILNEIAAEIAGLMDAQHVEDVCCLGIGVPGNVADGRFAVRCVNLGWQNVAVSDFLEKILHIPVTILNDASAAALGEYGHGASRVYDRSVFITIGTGIGGGLVDRGRLVEGAHGCGGEFGHMTLFPGEAFPMPCSCGKLGCLEQYTAAPAIVRQTKDALTASDAPSPLRFVAELQAKDVFDAAKAGDALALAVVDRVCFYLGVALANVAAVFDPAAFVIGGGISKAGRILTDTIRPYYQQHAYPGTENAEFVLATLGNEAGMYGAARFALDKLDAST